ncbi:unnamed protein product [Nesidiocoris tenuis]|uniref:Cytochrome P450 n=1 Tax=Nesidiocoris tenuis TaxID=355587 RepID=A0A6H5GBE7_9HEMI|nr:unnamed protein product [Nesidiocoris tenuis]
MEVLTALLAILASILGYLIYRGRKVNKYWEERGVPHETPGLFFGNSWSGLTGQESMLFDWKNKLYKKYPNAPLLGYYDLMRPILVVKDIGTIHLDIIS